MIHTHNKPKRRLEAKINHISFNDYGEPGGFDGVETPVVEWVRREGRFLRSERPLIDGYYIDHDRPDRTRQTTVRKALLEALATSNPTSTLWIEGLTDPEIIHLLTHQDYYQLVVEQADDEPGFSIGNFVTFLVEESNLTWEEGEEFISNHLKWFPSRSLDGMWSREECEDCWCTGVNPATGRRCRSCRGTGFQIE